MAYYETIYILRPEMTTEQVETINSRVAEIITANGGTILQTELWGRRELAYTVKKNTKGYYVFHVVEGGGSLVANLEARLKIDEDVLKFSNVRVDKPLDGASPLAVPDRPAEEGSEGGDDDDAIPDLGNIDDGLDEEGDDEDL